MKVMAIDPGNEMSGWVIMDENYHPLQFGKTDNQEFRIRLENDAYSLDHVFIEMITFYGKNINAGREVFETCVWIGRFGEIVAQKIGDFTLIPRPDVKHFLTGLRSAKDGQIVQVLKDRFGDKGTKANPGWFYGFKADCWQAYALGVYAMDRLKEGWEP